MKWTKTPLCYQGSKKNWCKTFHSLINTFYYLPLNKPLRFIDCFGGSGILSRWCKDMFPQSKVIYNDYHTDGENFYYTTRLSKIDATYNVLKHLYTKYNLNSLPPKTRIPDKIALNIKKDLIDIPEYEIDWRCVGNLFEFSTHYHKDKQGLLREVFYFRGRLPKTPSFKDVQHYLDGLTIKHCDFEELLNQDNSCHNVYLFDPPYVQYATQNSNQTSYNKLSNTQWCTIISFVNNLKPNNFYILFNSNKDKEQFYLVDLKQKLTRYVSCRYNAGYTDILYTNIPPIPLFEQVCLAENGVSII